MKRPADRHPLINSRAFRNALSQWFDTEGKTYPWRLTEDPWAILVSEIMLQQTTVASVIANQRFERFMEEFPDVDTIAGAPESKILRAWEGLGYYNRVRNLQKTAQVIVSENEGRFPKSAALLEKLPGIGRYTAGAVSSFAFNEPAPIVDGNIARVLARLFDFDTQIDSSAGQKEIWKWASELLDKESPRRFNSALMELGQTYCGAREVHCVDCPVGGFCQTQSPLSLPVKKPRKKFVKVAEHAFLILKDDKILLSKGSGSRRRGFWHLPLRSEDESARFEEESQHRYTITRYRVTVHLYRVNSSTRMKGEEFHPLDSLEELPIASPVRKIIKASL